MPLSGASGTENVNISIDQDLLARAREAGTDLSALMERALRFELLIGRGGQNRDLETIEDAQAVAAHNRFISEHGLLSDEWRKF